MKEGWTYKKLGEVCETLNGLWKGKKPPFVNVGVIRNANFTKDFTLRYDNVESLDVEEKQYVKRKLQRGDLIIEKSGGSEKQPVGRAVLFDKENGGFSFSNFTSVLRVKNGILQSRFLYIYLLFIYKRGDTLKMQKATTGIHNIEFDKYLNIDIPILPFAQQQRIVSHLDAAFAHIDALKANAEKQLAEARQLFQAELAECMRQKEGWEEKTLGEVCIKSKNIKWDNVDEGKTFTYIDLTSVDRTDLQIHNPQIINKHNSPSRAKQIIHSGDIIFATTRPTLRRVSLIDEQYDGDICSTGFCVLRPDNNVVSEWIFYALQEEHFYSYIEPLQAGANYPAVTDGDVKNYAIPIPSKDTQHSIVSRLDALSANIKKLEELQRKTLAECDALKQAMLKEVFE